LLLATSWSPSFNKAITSASFQIRVFVNIHFPSFISNTSIFSINFGANLNVQNAGNGISVLQISKHFLGVCPRP
jgi:hypothetical protein